MLKEEGTLILFTRSSYQEVFVFFKTLLLKYADNIRVRKFLF